MEIILIVLWLLSGASGFLLFNYASNFGFDGEPEYFIFLILFSFLGVMGFVVLGIPSIMSIIYKKHKR